MKILKEAKEKLPIDFITQKISKSWEEVGYLKADIQAIHDAFRGTEQIEEILQDLIDCTLITIGRLEKFVQDKKYIELPEEVVEIKEQLQEELLEELPDKKVLELEDEVIEEKHEDEQIEEECKKLDEDIIIISDKCCDDVVEPEENCNQFGFICDFDEPVGEKISDVDLYGCPSCDK